MTAEKLELLVYISSGLLFAGISLLVVVLWFLNSKKRTLLNQFYV